MRFDLRRYAPHLLIAVAVVLFGVQSIGLAHYMSVDFSYFYNASQRFFHNPVTLYQEGATANAGPPAVSLSGYLYPPPSIFIFLPFMALGKISAYRVYCGAIILAALAAFTLWQRLARQTLPQFNARWAGTCLIALALASGPIAETRPGQVDTIVLLFCAGAVFCWRNNRPVFGGGLLAIGCWIKIYPALLLIDLAVQPRMRRALAGFVVTALLVPLLSLTVIPLTLYQDYFAHMLPIMSGRAIINIDNQSLMAGATRWAMDYHIATTSFETQTIPHLAKHLIDLAALTTLAAFWWRVRSAPQDTLLLPATALAMIPLIAPLGWGHSFTYAVPLWMLITALGWARRDWHACALAALTYVFMLPSGHHIFALGANPPRCLWSLVYIRFSLCTLVLMVLGWRLTPKTRSAEPSAPAAQSHP